MSAGPRRVARGTVLLLLAVAACTPREKPPSPAAQEQIARAANLEREGDWSGAVAALEQATVVDPRSPLAAVRAGRLLAAMGLYGRAVRTYQGAIERTPRSPKAYLGLVSLYRSAGREALADRSVEAAIAALPRDTDVLLEAGRMRIEHEDLFGAAAALGAAVRARPNDAEGIYLLGRLEHRRRALDEADATLRKALERDPEHRAALLELAEVMREAHHVREELQLLRKLQLLGGELPDAARGELQRLETVAGNDAAAATAAESLRLSRELAPAIAHAREQLWAAVPTAPVLSELAHLLLRAKRPRDAEGIARGWASIEPAAAEAWLTVAEAAADGARAAQSRSALERAVVVAAPGDAAIAERVERLRARMDGAVSPTPSP